MNGLKALDSVPDPLAVASWCGSISHREALQIRTR